MAGEAKGLEEGQLDPVEFYEATIADRETGLRATVYTVPLQAVVSPREARNEEEFQRVWGGFVQGLLSEKRLSPGRLSPVNPFVSDILEALPDIFRDQLGELELEKIRTSGPPQTQPVRSFFNYLVSAPLIPVETSPLRHESLAALLAQGVAGGASAYSAIVFGDPSIILIGAFGIIVLQAASGIGSGLREGLKYQVLRALRVPTNPGERYEEERRKSEESDG